MCHIVVAGRAFGDVGLCGVAAGQQLNPRVRAAGRRWTLHALSVPRTVLTLGVLRKRGVTSATIAVLSQRTAVVVGMSLSAPPLLLPSMLPTSPSVGSRG